MGKAKTAGLINNTETLSVKLIRSNKMRILVLGGNGFLGLNLTRSLLEKGHQVRIFDIATKNIEGEIKSKTEIHKGSFSDTYALTEALEGIDLVFHLISTSIPSTSNIDPLRDIETNLMATVRLLQIMKKKSVNRLVFFSSGGTVYGNPEQLPVREDSQLNPICSYGVVKAAIENYLFMFKSLYNLEYTVIRPSNPYGPFQSHAGFQGLIGTVLNKILRNETIKIWGDGTVERDYIYVNDLTDFCIKILESPLKGIYNIGSSKSYSVNHVLEQIKKTLNVDIKTEFQPSRGFDVKQLSLDIKKATLDFGWTPKTSLSDGIDQVWNWLNNPVEKKG